MNFNPANLGPINRSRMNRGAMKSLVAALLLAGAAALALAGVARAAEAAEPSAGKPAAATRAAQAPGKKPAARAAAVPQACAAMTGVERKICAECDGVALFRRIGCQQRVFWTTCKGKRLFEDKYCQTHQDQGPPRGEGN